jgi:hypothetical protein
MDAQLPFENASPGGAVGLDVDVVDAAGAQNRDGIVGIHDVQS